MVQRVPLTGISGNNSFKEFHSDDPQEIVVDEVVGQMLPLLSIPIIIMKCFCLFVLAANA